MTLQKPMFATIAALGALFVSGAAQAAQGTVNIQNSTSANQSITSSFGSWAPLPLSPIGPFSSSGSQPGKISFPPLGVIVNSVRYQDPNTSKGCDFRVQTEIFNGRCSVVLTPQPYGVSGGGQTATCTGSLNSVNPSTCDFNATFTISGF